jgi:hypothetical protein
VIGTPNFHLRGDHYEKIMFFDGAFGSSFVQLFARRFFFAGDANNGGDD